jgi:hypothetical protein
VSRYAGRWWPVALGVGLVTLAAILSAPQALGAVLLAALIMAAVALMTRR